MGHAPEGVVHELHQPDHQVAEADVEAEGGPKEHADAGDLLALGDLPFVTEVLDPFRGGIFGFLLSALVFHEAPQRAGFSSRTG